MAGRNLAEVALAMNMGLSNESILVLGVLFGIAMVVVVGLMWFVHHQDGSADIRPGPRTMMPADGSFPEAAAAILRADPTSKIAAIKAYREATGMGLKESKDAVEAWLAANQ